eukprot:2653268-Pyramimonas_sp.AAC.1
MRSESEYYNDLVVRTCTYMHVNNRRRNDNNMNNNVRLHACFLGVGPAASRSPPTTPTTPTTPTARILGTGW